MFPNGDAEISRNAFTSGMVKMTVYSEIIIFNLVLRELKSVSILWIYLFGLMWNGTLMVNNFEFENKYHRAFKNYCENASRNCW